MLKLWAAKPLILAIAARTISADESVPPFKITTKRDNDRVKVKFEKDKNIAVVSPEANGVFVRARVSPR